MKCCSKCGEEKVENYFHMNNSWCKDCMREYQKRYRLENSKDILENKQQYYIENKENILEKRKQHYVSNKQKMKDYCKNYSLENKEELKKYKKWYRTQHKEQIKNNNKKYCLNNKCSLKEYRNLYYSNKWKSDPLYKLRKNISRQINITLHKMETSKNNISCLKYLNYTPQQLKVHLESQFEPWMTWDNHGKYDVKTWDDNNPATWTWQLDHVIPQSDLPYSSMEDDNFKKCWTLENLRPLSAKQNITDGTMRVRHIKK